MLHVVFVMELISFAVLQDSFFVILNLVPKNSLFLPPNCEVFFAVELKTRFLFYDKTIENRGACQASARY